MNVQCDLEHAYSAVDPTGFSEINLQLNLLRIKAIITAFDLLK